MSDTIGSMVEDSGAVVVQEVGPASSSTASAVESLLDPDMQARLAAELVQAARTQRVDLVRQAGRVAGRAGGLPARQPGHPHGQNRHNRR